MESNKLLAVFLFVWGVGVTISLINTFKTSGKITWPDIFWALTLAPLVGNIQRTKE